MRQVLIAGMFMMLAIVHVTMVLALVNSHEEGLLSHYPMNGTCKDVVSSKDCICYGYGYGNSFWSFQPSTERSPLRLDGRGYCQVEGYRNHQWDSDLSVCAWFNRTDNTPSLSGIVSNGDLKTGATFDIAMNKNLLGGRVVTSQNPRSWPPMEITVDRNAAWVHTCIAYNGTTLKQYKDGVMEKSYSNFKGELKKTGNPVFIGYALTPNAYFHGFIDDVRIYERAITPFDVQKIYYDEAPAHDHEVLCTTSTSTSYRDNLVECPLTVSCPDVVEKCYCTTTTTTII